MSDKEKDVFHKLENGQWVLVPFEEIKAGDVVVRDSCRDCYYTVVEPSAFDEDLAGNAISAELMEKPSAEYTWPKEHS